MPTVIYEGKVIDPGPQCPQCGVRGAHYCVGKRVTDELKKPPSKRGDL